MVSYLDAILNILEGHNSVADLLICCHGLSGREKVFQDLHHSFPERCVEVFENKMWIGLAHSTFAAIGKVVAQENIV